GDARAASRPSSCRRASARTARPSATSTAMETSTSSASPSTGTCPASRPVLQPSDRHANAPAPRNSPLASPAGRERRPWCERSSSRGASRSVLREWRAHELPRVEQEPKENHRNMRHLLSLSTFALTLLLISPPPSLVFAEEAIAPGAEKESAKKSE